jgi:branched-chain amino acid aminotransferase
MKIYLDGKLVDKEDAKISVFDHGYLYGDGVFEGIRSYDGCVFRLKEHLERLYESAHSIMLKIPMSMKDMQAALIKTLKANKLKDAYIRLIVSRGVGDLGLDPRKCKGDGTVVIIADKIALYPEELCRNGLKLITVPTTRNLPEALNPQIKSLNYLNNIMAKIEAVNGGCQEAIMLNAMGYVAECTGDNIFIVKNGRLMTPPIWMGSLKGITRQAVLDIAKKLKVPAEESVLSRHDLFVADECFLTGTAAEVIPVATVDGRTIGSGKPGPVTKKLLQGFHSLVKKDGVKYTV